MKYNPVRTTRRSSQHHRHSIRLPGYDSSRAGFPFSGQAIPCEIRCAPDVLIKAIQSINQSNQSIQSNQSTADRADTQVRPCTADRADTQVRPCTADWADTQVRLCTADRADTQVRLCTADCQISFYLRKKFINFKIR